MSNSLYTLRQPARIDFQEEGTFARVYLNGDDEIFGEPVVKEYVDDLFVPLDIDNLKQQIDDIICDVIDDSQMCIDYAGFSNQVDERKIAMEARSRLLALLGIKGE